MNQETKMQPQVWYRFFGRLWEAFLDFGAVLVPMRFSVIVLIAGTLLLLFVQQAQDALYVLVGGASVSIALVPRLIFFAIFTFIWAFNTFYAANFMSRLPRRGRIERIMSLSAEKSSPIHLYPPALIQAGWIAKLNSYLPYLLGAMVIIAVDGSLLRASAQRLPFPVCALIVAAGVAMLVIYWYVLHRYHRPAQTRYPYATLEDSHRDLGSHANLPAWCRRLVFATVVITFAVLIASTRIDLQVVHLRVFVALAITFIFGVGLLALSRSQGIPYGTKRVVAVQATVVGALFLLSLFPEARFVADVLGAPGVVVLAAAGWAFGGTLFIVYLAEVTRLPILLGLVVLAVASSLFGNRDNHVIREVGLARDTRPSVSRSFTPNGPYACRRLSKVGDVGSGEGQDVATDPFAQSFDRWCNVAAAHWGGKGRIPLVIIATAGGASRAAYWTEKVLAELEGQVPGFHDYVFAISSVSGGTLGTAAYRLSLDFPPTTSDPGTSPRRGADCTTYRTHSDPASCILAMLQRDFLSSLLLGALYSDLVQRFLPGWLLPDRASALERSWEGTWARSFPQYPQMTDGFLTSMNAFMATPGTWRPLLFFNGTSVVTGRRVITSNLPIDGHFSDAIDFFGWESPDTNFSRDIPISTAVHNSARFPYLDAAGDVIVNGSIVDRIVDGGYFENYGAATALDVLEQLIDRGAVGPLDESASDKPGERTIDPIIIQISNDASVPPKLPLASDAPAPATELATEFRLLSDVFTPPTAFYDTRYGLGQRATDVLRRRLAYLRKNGANDRRYFHFQIADEKVPMSWLLSDYAGDLIDKQLPLDRRPLGEQKPPAATVALCQDPNKIKDDPSIIKRHRPDCNIDEFIHLVDLLHFHDQRIAGNAQ